MKCLLRGWWISLFAVTVLLLAGRSAYAIGWPGDRTFEIELQADKVQPGQELQVRTVGTYQHRRERRVDEEVMQEYKVRFFLLPLRYNFFMDTPREIPARAESPNLYRISIPEALPPNWYILFAQVSDKNGDFADPMDRGRSDEMTHTVLAVASRDGSPQIRGYTERMRCVFSLGESVRFFVSGRGARPWDETVTLRLRPAPDSAAVLDGISLGSVQLAAQAGQTAVQAVDLDPVASKSIAPGVYALEVVVGGNVVDRYPVEFVSPSPSSGGGRWAHNQTAFGNSPGFDPAPSNPFRLHSRRYRGMADGLVAQQHRASLWVNFSATGYPIEGPNPFVLPYADDADMPPAASAFRPSLTHAFYEIFHRNHTAIGLVLGYGERGSENYMPVPGEIQQQMDDMARKYVLGALGAQQFPHFVSVYTDWYGHLDFYGAHEMTDEQTREVRDAAWRNATAAAGMDPNNRPVRYQFDSQVNRLPQIYQEIAKGKENAYRDFWRNVDPAKYGSEGGRNWHANIPFAQQERLWADSWASIGISPAPPGIPVTPLPNQFTDPMKERYGDTENYLYSSYLLRGIERMYSLLTQRVEQELPAVFSIHNRLGMNHSPASHAWTGFRTPNIDPAYARGATAISASEWNLDGVPKPFFLSTYYNQTLQDEGRAVYRCGLWGQAGMTTRFMRDAIHWAGRQVHVYFDDAGNLTYSHKGADQSTYASRDRIQAVSELLEYYTDLFNHLQPVREVGFYVPPDGAAWGNMMTRVGHYTGMLTALLCDHQVHMVSHGDIERDGLRQYPILYTAATQGARMFPFEREGFQAYVAQGGHIVGAPMPNYFHSEETYQGSGITRREVPDIDPATGEPRTNRDGSVRMRSEWTETPEQWAAVTRSFTWGFLDRNVEVAPLDLYTLYTHKVDGEPATHSGSHWTGHHHWHKFRAPATDQYANLQSLFDNVMDPFVRKSEPWVFTNVNRPADPDTEGFFLFASNWLFPEEEGFHELRVPQQFFNSGVAPTVATLKVKAEGIGAIYDIIAGEKVAFEREGDRLVFTCDLTSVEGRIFALYPEEVAQAALLVPESVEGGRMLQARFHLQNAGGVAMPVLASVRIRLLAGSRVLVEKNRALPGDGRLPLLSVPNNLKQPLTLHVTDTITGFEATAEIPVTATPIRAQVADPVTVFRGDKIHEWLKEHGGDIRVMVTEGTLKHPRDGKPVSVEEKNPGAQTERAVAGRMLTALQGAGVRASLATNVELFDREIYGHPWRGPSHKDDRRAWRIGLIDHIGHPVIVVGSPETNPYLLRYERTYLAPRALQDGNLGPGRAVIAWAPAMFTPNIPAVMVVASDQAGFEAATARLAELAQVNPGPDPFYEARERVRFSWTPSEVTRFKRTYGYTQSAWPNPVQEDGLRPVQAERTWGGLTNLLGTPIVNMNASPAGVAVGTKSWVRPFGMLDADGEVLGFWGGGDEITPRDVGISADGRMGVAAFNLLGVVAGFRPGEGQLWKREMGIVHHSNPYSWDSFKESERGLGTSPNNDLFVINAGASEGVLGIDAASGEIRWRVRCDAPADRPRGFPTPEFGFSHDGTRVLLRTQEQGEPVRVRYKVKYRDIDPGSGRFKHEREAYDKDVEVEAIPTREVVQLLDTQTGKPVWTRTVGFSLSQQVTPEEGRVFWRAGRDAPVYFAANAHGQIGEFKPVDDDQLPLVVGTGQPPFDVAREEILNVPFWHLYSAVGTGGAWSILGTREPDFLLLHNDGSLLRNFGRNDMPRELNPGREIPPRILTGRDPNTLLLFAGEMTRAFVYNLHIGSPAQIERARTLTENRQRIARELRSAWTAGRNEYRSWDNEDRRKAVLDPLNLPADLRAMADDIMRRMPGEHRAGRRRDFRWMQGTYNDILNALHYRDLEELNAAANLVLRTTIELPGMICEGALSDDMRVFYVGLWDGTVRAYDTGTGRQLWSASVVGGSQIALERDAEGRVTAVYAGGSRGDLFKLHPEDGRVIWHRNITPDTNAFSRAE